MQYASDVLIIGGGVIGLTSAYYLAREGLSVTVVERGDIGREASWAGAGILPPGNPTTAQSPFDRLRALGFVQFPSLSDELRQRTGSDNGYIRSGGLEFPDEHHEASREEWRGSGIACESLDDTLTARMEPEVTSGLGPVYHLPDLAQLRNPRHLKALLAGCQEAGVQIVAGCPVFGFECAGSLIKAVHTAQGKLAADRYVLSAGAWSDGLLQQLGWNVGLKPIRGQIALLNTQVPLFWKVLLQGRRYLVPRGDGLVLAGSTEEDVGFIKRTTAEAIAGLLQFAVRLVPKLAQAHLEHSWAGFRPGTPDGMPILGVAPNYSNLILATGHFRAGIQLSIGTAVVITEIVLSRPLSLPLESFSIERFPRNDNSNTDPW